MATRRGPKIGYDVPRKRQYRRDVWALFRRFCGVFRFRSHALLMPSIEGDEIDVALACGFREQNLHVVDNNPAIVATLKRRYTYINTYGVDAAVALRRIAAKGIRLSVANFDLTAPVATDGYLDLAEVIATTDAWTPRKLVAFTALKGRENPDYLNDTKDFVTRHMTLRDDDPDYAERFKILALTLAYSGEDWTSISFVRGGQYRTNKVPMIWCVLCAERSKYTKADVAADPRNRVRPEPLPASEASAP